MTKYFIIAFLFFQAVQASETALVAALLATDWNIDVQNPLSGAKATKETARLQIPSLLDSPSAILRKKSDEDETRSLEEVCESSDSDEDSGRMHEDQEAAGALFVSSKKSPKKTVSAHAQAMIAAAKQELEEAKQEEGADHSIELKKANRSWKEWFAGWWSKPQEPDEYELFVKSMDTDSLKQDLDKLQKKLEKTFDKQVIRQKVLSHYAGPKGLDLSVDVLGLDDVSLQAALERKIKEMEFESEEDTVYSRILLVEIEHLIELYDQSAENLDDIEYKIECIEKELRDRTHLVKSKKRRRVIV
jgi:hypothetical protein